MNCIQCGAEMRMERRNMPYRSLPGAVLLDAEVWQCDACGEYEVVIPAINELDRVLAHVVAGLPGRLVAGQIKFLRKHLGWSGSDFARHFGVTKETVSRWEHGTPMGAQAERLLRVCATRLEPLEDYRELEELLDRQGQEAPSMAPLLRVQRTGDRWEIAA